MTYLVLKDITKRYKDTGILANDHISITIEKGEVHAIVGENGAGKSTLGKILYGVVKRDCGDILLDGKKLKLNSEHEARSEGIYFVPQEDFFIESFKVWENIVLGGEDAKWGFLNKRELKKRVDSIMKEYGLYLPKDVSSSVLSVGQKRILSILKALYKRPKILILDEPTSFLPDPQVDEFLQIILSLKKMGLTIIFISHRWKEIEKVADRITILDKGRVLGRYTKDEFKIYIKKKFSKDGITFLERKKIKRGGVVFSFSHIYYEKKGHIPLSDINIELEKGEVLSILSISGNGEKELEALLSGYIHPTRGEIFLKGKKFGFLTPKILRKEGVSIIPTDTEYGICDYATLWENVIISRQRQSPISNGFFLNFNAIKSYSSKRLKEFDVDYPLETKARFLSGGRKRRVIISRELRDDIDILIAGNPLSSLDSFFSKEVLRRLKDLAIKGVGIIFFSHNIDDALMLSDKIAILYKGKIRAIYENGKVLREELITSLTGGKNV